MLIPRPSQAAPAPRPTESGDPLRERLAQVEVQAAATRSISSRVELEASRAHARLDAIDPRIGAVETTVRERIAKIEGAVDAARKALESRIDDMGSMGTRATMPMHVEDPAEMGLLKTALATLRHNVAEHERQFEARRARVESLETRVTSIEGDPRMVEVRRAVEGFDLRLHALEQSQHALRESVEARLAAMEARFAEAAPKAKAPEPELRRIKGVGPKYEKALREVGITTIAQVAAMGDDDLARVAAQLSVPVERIRKLGWPEIARALLAE
jgi:predicted flap endonuclease-1-like 5' DNA nuclease